MVLEIDHRSTDTIERSFDRIAKEIMHNYGIKVNDNFFRFSEIEFYYFDPLHPDKYARKHTIATGEWLFNRRGLELTLAGGSKRYGSILIRGIYSQDERYTNGPFQVTQEIFRSIGKIGKKSFLQFLKSFPVKKKILKTRRYGIHPDKSRKFYAKKYRYLIEPEKLKIKPDDLQFIRKNHTILT